MLYKGNPNVKCYRNKFYNVSWLKWDNFDDVAYAVNKTVQPSNWDAATNL